VAVASAGPDASLHLAPDRQPQPDNQHPTTLVFYRPIALPATQPTNSDKALKAKQCTHKYKIKY